MARSVFEERLAGRDAESTLLEDLVARTAAGQCGVVWIEGPSGIGKTRMLTAMTDAARQTGIHVAAAAAEELEQLRPFGVLARALGCTSSSPDPRRARIGALIHTHERTDRGTVTITTDPGLQFRAVDLFADLVEELAASGPLLLAVDDLQWADASSLLALIEIARRMAGTPLLLAGCLRSTSETTPLRGILDSSDPAHTTHLRLSSLTPRGVGDLVTQLMGAVPGPRLLEQIAVADGRPLFITEMLSALEHEGALRRAARSVELVAPVAPSSLHRTVRRRLGRLPIPVLDVLKSAAILGSTFAVVDLAATTGRSVAVLHSTLTQALDAEVLAVDGDDFAFRHDLIHEAVYEEIPDAIVTALHRDAARRLADAGATPGTVAAQLLRSASPGDPDAIAWLLDAAREAAPSFPDTAAELLAHALELMDVADPARGDVMVERADALMLARRLSEALSVCRTVLERGRADHAEAGALLRLGSGLTVTGLPAEAVVHLEKAHGHPAADPVQRAIAASEVATAQLWLGDLDSSAHWARAAEQAAGPEEAEPAVIGALAARSVVCTLRAELGTALDVSESAKRRAQRAEGASAHHYPLQATHGFLLLELDLLEQARIELETGRRRSEEAGVLWPLPTYQAYLGVERFLRGQWDDAVSELETSIALIEDSCISFAASTVHTVMAMIRVHRDDLLGAVASVDAATAALPRGPHYARHRLTRVRALLAEAHGDRDAARRLLTEAWEGCESDGILLDLPRIAPDLVRLSLDRGSRDVAEHVAVRLAAHDGSPAVASRRAALQYCRGLIADDGAVLVQAADDYARAGLTLETALARQEAASVLMRHGEQDRARDLFLRAQAGFEGLHADRDLRGLDARLREVGMPPGKRGPRRRPTRGWESLTDTERRVAELVGEGLTNPQIGSRLFISRRTVQTHVSHIFAKLELTRRAQLAAEVAGRAREAS